MSITSPRRRKRLTAFAGVAVAAALTVGGLNVWWDSSKGTGSAAAAATETVTDAGNTTVSAAIPKAGKVCSQPVLRSPFSYTGKTGSYKSGKAGLPTFGKAGTNFPKATAGVVLPAGAHSYQDWQLRANTVYFLVPGVHIGNIVAKTGDVFVGGYANGVKTTLTGQYKMRTAIDSNTTYGNQPGIIIEYLNIEQYAPYADQAAINQEANTSWTIRYNTIAYNVPGAGIIAGSGNVIKDNCISQNGQYAFQSENTNGYGLDSLTKGTFGVTVIGNEISLNDTCDFTGLLNVPAVGWKNRNPVPAKYRNSHCGKVVGDGNYGGFKLWTTDGVTIESNYIHDNWGPGGWADTNNVNTTWLGNLFVHNDNAAILEEVSYNFSITHNTMIDNDWADGLANPGFPQPAIYVSESGSDTTFGGIPACTYSVCKSQGSYKHQSVITKNKLVDNGGGIFLWQSSNRGCGDGFDPVCTLVGGGSKSPFTQASCAKNLPAAKISLSTWVGQKTGSPAEDWWDGCMWRTENVLITQNEIDFNPAHIPNCNSKVWQDCGANGIFSQYGGPAGSPGGWAIPTDVTFFQHNLWTNNIYNGPTKFLAWNQGNVGAVTWAQWTGARSKGDMCTSSGARQSGYCAGPFGEDAGGTYNKTPLS